MSARGHVMGLCFAMAMLAGCSKPPPPKPPEPPPPVATVVEAPPPAKCEALTEACSATPETRARIPGAKLVFAPPTGWTFAQEASATVAQKGRAMLVLLTREVKEPKKPPRAEALTAVIDRLGATFPRAKGKARWPRKADRVLKVGALEVSLYQLDGAKREGGKGPVLVFSAALPSGPLLVGGGFVPEDDSSNADAEILASIESMAEQGAAVPSP